MTKFYHLFLSKIEWIYYEKALKKVFWLVLSSLMIRNFNTSFTSDVGNNMKEIVDVSEDELLSKSSELWPES